MKKAANWDWLYEWVDEGKCTRRSHGRVYFSYFQMRMLMVLWPFNYLVIVWGWISYCWDTFRCRPTILDREIIARAAIMSLKQ